jgi:hypothetical protein
MPIIFFDEGWLDRLAAKFRDGMLPKVVCCVIGLHHANLPLAGKSLPHLMRCCGSYSASAVCAKNEELCYVPDGIIA